MEQITDEEVVCIFDNEDNVPIFDKDEQQGQQASTGTSIKLIEQNQNADKQMMKKVEEEVLASKQNFFKVTFVKMPAEQVKSKKKIQQAPLSKKTKVQRITPKNKNMVLREGYLNKKTDGFFFKWHRRYLVLTSEKLYSFASIKKIELIGCVNLKLLRAKVKQNSSAQNEFLLDFMGQCQNLILKADSANDKKQWMTRLKQVIEYQQKESKVMIQTLVKPIYDSKESMTESQFIKSAETGDILLFYTQNTGAKIQRIFTNSDFDHVAMVVKFRKNELMVFESNQMYGVSVYDWKQYIKYFDLYEKVTLRKLNYIKKADVQRQLLDFVKNNIGKSYELNMNKIITLESDVNWDNINKEKNKQRGYFCSELIAKAFKSVGLLDSKKSSGRYWPVDFAQKSGLMLKKGASLQRQESVILNKHLKNHI